jgi:transcriptional regulator with XRE-family HTH domain
MSTWTPADERFYAVHTGRLIRATRCGLGLTMTGLGRRLDPPMCRATINHYELGMRSMTVETLAGIASALGVGVVDLLPPDPWAEDDERWLLEDAS